MQPEPHDQIAGLDEETALPAALADGFLVRATTVHARRGQILISHGSEADDVFLIVRGKLQISTFSVNGRETILRQMGPGRLVGEMAAISATPRSATVAAVEETVLGRLSGGAFRTFLHEVPGAGYWMAVQLASRVRNLSEKTTELATLPVSARLHSELLRMAVVAGQGDERCEIKPLPTHADLAARIGTHREAVTRELGLLEQEGLVSRSGRALVIPSITRLKALLERLAR